MLRAITVLHNSYLYNTDTFFKIYGLYALSL